MTRDSDAMQARKAAAMTPAIQVTDKAREVRELQDQVRRHSGCIVSIHDIAAVLLTLEALAMHKQQAEGVDVAREKMRQQGQDEGFAAAVQWLRDRSAMKPRASLWSAALELADQMEQSRAPHQALSNADGVQADLRTLLSTLERPAAEVTEAEADAIDEALRVFHYQAFIAGMLIERDEWPTDDEEWADFHRGVDSVAVGEHYEGWSEETRVKLYLAMHKKQVEGVDVERVAWEMARVMAYRHGHKPDDWMNDERREEARAAIAAVLAALNMREANAGEAK